MVVYTNEEKFVHADASSDQDWIKVLPSEPRGKSVNFPLHIEIPPRPGETLHATVTFRGNGQQRFVLPVTLTVADNPPVVEEKKKTNPSHWLRWSIAAGVLFLCLATVLTLVMSRRHANSNPVNPPPDEPVVSSGHETPADPPEQQQPQKVEAWWDGIPRQSSRRVRHGTEESRGGESTDLRAH